MIWTRWMVMSMDLFEEEPGEHIIGLTAEFNINRGSIPNICHFEMGIVGGKLSLTSDSGRIMQQHCWGHEGHQTTDAANTFFCLHNVEIKGSETDREWHISHPKDWHASRHKIAHIQGRLDQNHFTRIVDTASPEPISAIYRVEPHHLLFTHLDLSPLIERYGDITAEQRLILTALIRDTLQQQFGELVCKASLPTTNEINHPFTETAPALEQIIEILLSSVGNSLTNLIKESEFNNNYLFRGMCFRNTDLQNEDFTNYNLQGCNFFGISLTGATLKDTHMDDANLHNVDMRKSKLTGKPSFKNANLSHADIRGLEFPKDTIFHGANFTEAKLSKTKFIKAYLMGCRFNHAKLIGAKLRGADLSYADLSDADLSNADLSDAILEGANLTNATMDGVKVNKNTNLRGTNFKYVNLKNVVKIEKCANYDQALLEDAYGLPCKATLNQPLLEKLESERRRLEEKIAAMSQRIDELGQRIENFNEDEQLSGVISQEE